MRKLVATVQYRQYDLKMMSDFDNLSTLLKRNVDVVPMRDMFEKQQIFRPKNLSSGQYSKRIIRDIIKAFWAEVVHMMIYDGFVLLLPLNKFKIGIGSIARIPRRWGTEEIIKGRFLVLPRLIMMKKRKAERHEYNVYFGKKYMKMFLAQKKKGFSYNHFSVLN